MTMVAVPLLYYYSIVEDDGQQMMVALPKVVVSLSDLISFVDDMATIVAVVPQLLLYYFY